MNLVMKFYLSMLNLAIIHALVSELNLSEHSNRNLNPVYLF